MSTLLPCVSIPGVSIPGVSILGVSILAVGCFVCVSSAQAVLRVGTTSAICPNTCIAAPACTHCRVLRVPRPGDPGVANLQSPPPKIYFHGRPSHR